MALFSPRVRASADNGQDKVRKVAASAVRLALGNRRKLKRQVSRRQEWQSEAWDYFDDVGEVKYPALLSGAVMSKLRFFVAVRPPDDPDGEPIPATDPESGIPAPLAARARAELDRLKSPFGGRAEIIRMLQINLEVAAEANLVCIGPRLTEAEDVRTGETVEQIVAESWEVKSVDEVEVREDGKTFLHQVPGDMGMLLDEDQGDAAIRIWQRHARFGHLPDNAMRGVLGICESLVLLENQVKAIAKSHQSAGFFTIPNQLNLIKDAAFTSEGEDDDEEHGPTFLQRFNETLAAPIEDPAAAESVAPMPITGDAEFLKPDVLRHISLHRPNDETLEARIEGRVMRLARGLNHPVETITGLMSTTFANAAEVTKDKFRDHYEPRAVLICDMLTVAFLQPYLLMAGENPDLVEQLLIWYDPSAIIEPVEPTVSAKDGWEQGTISDAAWRRVMGWSEDDAPDEVEWLLRAVMRIRSLDPGLSTAILELLGVSFEVPESFPARPISSPDDEQQAAGQGRPLTEALLMLLAANKRGEVPADDVVRKVAAAATPEAVRAARKANANVGRQLMDLDRDLRSRLLVAAHAAMTRALERAGNRVKTKTAGRLSKSSQADVRELIRTLHPRYVAATMGRQLVASAGFTDDDLIGNDAWVALEQQFMTWGAQAQAQALRLVGGVVAVSSGDQAALQGRQANDLREAWTWMRDALHDLAVVRLYAPDPAGPGLGEFDPSTNVPPGLIRQAIARAGGATGLQPAPIRAARTDYEGLYVVTNNGQPPGGIGTGELISETLADGGAGVEAYEWVYGPAYREHPFEDHERLDTQRFVEFDDPVLSADGSWIGSGSFYPGDHAGCSCDIAPIVIGPDENTRPGVQPWQTGTDSSDITGGVFNHEAEAYMREVGLLDEVEEEFDRYAERALDYYQGDGYRTINTALRDGRTIDSLYEESERLGDAVSEIDRLVSAHRTDREVTYFRGVSGDWTLRPGQQFTDNGFASTSVFRTVAEQHGSGRVFEIVAPAGTPGLYLGGFGEGEVILARGTTFEVIDIAGDVVRLRIVP